jgi:hypothetical protein
LGSADRDASDRLLHSETAETRVPDTSSSPGAAVTRAWPFGAPTWMLSFRGLRLVPTRPASRRVPPLRPKTKDQASRSSGPLDANETGENRVSRRDPHFGDPILRTCGVVLPRARLVDPPLTSLSPPPCCPLVESRLAIDASTRRPPRSVPRGPRERRALLRPEMSFIARSLAPIRSRRSTSEPRSSRRNAAFT